MPEEEEQSGRQRRAPLSDLKGATMEKVATASAGGFLTLLLSLLSTQGPAIAKLIETLLLILRPKTFASAAGSMEAAPAAGTESTDARVLKACDDAKAAGVDPSLIEFILRGLATEASHFIAFLQAVWAMWKAPPPPPPLIP